MKRISDELNLNNKKILLRLDLNVPLTDDELWLKSIDTSFSDVISNIFLDWFFETSLKASLIFSLFSSFLVQKTNSIRDTFGVGTLIATPSNLPFNDGIISPIAFEAPVDVGTIDWLADLALLGSLWELSKIVWHQLQMYFIKILKLKKVLWRQFMLLLVIKEF